MNATWKCIALAVLLLSAGCGKQAGPAASAGGRYACPMLCVITDHPGDCPVCGMEMAPVTAGLSAGRNSMELDEASVRRSSIRTAPAVEDVPHLDIPMFGRVAADEERTAVISAWADGRVDRLYAETTGTEVRQGQKLASLYSPGLISAQQELIQAVQSGNERLAAVVREKLRRYGIDDAQIETVARRTEPLEQLDIIAPAAGTVLMKNVTEGDYVKHGQILYRLADLSTVWIELHAYETDLPHIRAGQTATIEPGGLHGEIILVEPEVNPQTRTAGVRIGLPNPDGALRPGMLVRATVHVPGSKPAVLIPASAPLFTGERAIVYVRIGANVFEGRDVVTGPRAGERIVIKQGIQAGEEVVVNGAFRIDAAMQISGRASMMNRQPEAAGAPMPSQPHAH